MDYEGYSIAKYIPYPDICLNAIEKFETKTEPLVLYSFIDGKVYNESPEIARKTIEADGLCIGYIPEKNLNEELALIAVSNTDKVIKVLSLIPDELCTQKLCERAVTILPGAIRCLPEDNCTPELFLLATKQDAGLKTEVPEYIRNNKNIYSVNERLEKITPGKEKLTFEQVKEIYLGGSVKVQQVKSSGQILNDKNLSYDKNMDRFIITNGQKQENKIPAPRIDNSRHKKGRGI